MAHTSAPVPQPYNIAQGMSMFPGAAVLGIPSQMASAAPQVVNSKLIDDHLSVQGIIRSFQVCVCVFLWVCLCVYIFVK